MKRCAEAQVAWWCSRRRLRRHVARHRVSFVCERAVVAGPQLSSNRYAASRREGMRVLWRKPESNVGSHPTPLLVREAKTTADNSTIMQHLQ